MYKAFFSYFLPTEDQFSMLWREGLFVLDTNVLLDLYRYSHGTSDELLKVLAGIESRLWIPHQVGLEYARNRPGVILAQTQAFDKAISALKKELGKSDWMQEALDEAALVLERHKQKYYSTTHDDQILNKLATLFTEDRVGAPYSFDRLENIYNQGEKRYSESVPPGNKDAGQKEGVAIYGDLILWFQIIDKAKEMSCPIIFITSELKEDWWWKINGKTIGPRPELIEEIKTEAGVLFYMYSADRFMHFAKKYLNASVDPEAIEEIEQVQKRSQPGLKTTYRPGLLADTLKDLLEGNKFITDSVYDEMRAQTQARDRLLAELSSPLHDWFTAEEKRRQDLYKSLASFDKITSAAAIGAGLERMIGASSTFTHPLLDTTSDIEVDEDQDAIAEDQEEEDPTQKE